MENNKEAKLILDIFFIDNNDKRNIATNIIIENQEYKLDEIDNKEIKIKFNDFESDLDSKIINMTFIYNEEKESLIFEIIPGINRGILFPYFRGIVKDIIFLQKQKYKVEIQSWKTKKKYEIDNNRLLLININYAYYLYINNISLTEELGYLPSQICINDLSKNIIFHRDITNENFNLFFEKNESFKKDAEYFYNEIKNILGSNNKFNYDEFIKLFSKENFGDILYIQNNFSKKILQEYFNKKENFDFISHCCLYYILFYIKEENNETKLKNIYQYFDEYKIELEKDSNLEYYMKNIIIIEFSLLLKEVKDLEKFKDIKFTYYNTNQIDKGSPLSISLNFLNNLIDNLDEKSPFYYPLILINSGDYTYNKNNAYGYELKNIETLKSHLKNALPYVVITIDNEEINLEKINTNKTFNSFVFNLYKKILFPLKEYDISKKVENEDINNNLVLIIFLTLFYELFGKNKKKSANVFYDINKKSVIKLIEKDCIFSYKNEIKILERDGDNNSKYIMQYFLGQCKYGFYSELIEKMIIGNINLNFILDINLWNEKIEVLRKYIELKYIVFSYDKNLISNKKYKDIYDEIKDLEKIIAINNIKLNIIDPDINELIKDANKVMKEFNRYRKLSFEELKGKLNSEETHPELRKIIRQILLILVIRR